MRARSTGLLVLALLICVVLGVYIYRTALAQAPQVAWDTSIAAADVRPPASGPGSSESREPVEPSAGPIPAADPPETIRHVLSTYSGNSWPDIEEKMTRAGLELDDPYEGLSWEEASLGFEPLLPLSKEESAAHVRDAIQWPDQRTAAWLKTEYGYRGTLSDEVKSSIDTLAAPFNEQLAALGAEIARQIDFAVRLKWQQGDFLRAPFSTLGLSGESGFHSAAYAGNGWAITITLKEQEYPDVAGMISQASRIRETRDQNVQRFLRSR